MNDGELLAQYIRERSETALRQLVERHTPLVYAACLRRLDGDSQRAEEAVQAVFTALAMQPGKVGRPEALSGWLHRLSQFVVSHMKREEKRRRHHEQMAVERKQAMQTDTQAWQDVQPHLDACIDGLPEKQRNAVVLYYLEGMKEAQIAAQFGVSESTIRNYLNGGLERLRTKLNASGVLFSAAGLSTLLAANVAQSAPAALVQSASSAALSAALGQSALSASAAVTAKGALNMIMWANVKVACFWAALVLIGVTPLAVHLASAEEKAKPVARPAPVAEPKKEETPKKPEKPKKPGPTVTLEARASLLDGTPAAGVKVTFVSRPWVGHRHESREVTWSGVTDEKGILRIEAPADDVEISATCRIEPDPTGKLAPCSIEMPQAGFARRNAGRKATILMAPATGGVNGVVTDADNKPIAGVVIDLDLDGDYGTCKRKATTDANGRYQFLGLAAGHYTVHCVAPPAGSPWIRLDGWKMRKPVGVADGKTSTQDFQLPRGARLLGRVLDENGKPVADAVVSCRTDSATEVGPQNTYQMPGQWYSGEARTDKDGRYALGAVTQETYQITVKPPEGSVLAWASVHGINALQGQDVPVQDIALIKGATIQGVACGPDGKPIAAAEAELSAFNARMLTDDKGRFTFKGLPTGSYSVTVTPPEESAWRPNLLKNIAAIRGFSVEQRAELPLGATVTGLITDPDGKPVSGACIYANYQPPGQSHGGSSARAVTDETGRFTMAGVGNAPDEKPGGKWRLYAAPPDSALTLKGVELYVETLEPGKTIEKCAQLVPGAAAVNGIVTGPDGKPVAGCRMAVVRMTQHSCTGINYAAKETDAGGRFTIGQIEPDTWSVTAEPPEGANLVPFIETPRRLSAGMNEVTVALKKGAAVFGKALTTKGEPVVGATIAAQNIGKDRQWIPSMNDKGLSARTAADGVFRLSGLPAGEFKLSCSPVNPEYRGTETTVRVAAAADTEAMVNVFRVSGVRGRIAGKMLPPDCYLDFVPEAGERARAYVENGQFRLYHLPPGTYTLKLSFWKDRKEQVLPVASPKEIVIKEGEDTELQVTTE